MLRRGVISLLLGLTQALIPSTVFAQKPPPKCPEIWFAPMDAEYRPQIKTGGSVDFMDLFRSDAPWLHVASHVTVFNLNGWFIGHASDADILHAISWLREHKIAVGTNLGLLTPRLACGKGIEGYSSNYSMMVVNRLKRLGGTLDYIQMDEPLWFGHEPGAAPTACHLTIDQVAEDVAGNLQKIRTIFPDVKNGDVEPISNFGNPDWLDEINQWSNAYHSKTGQKLSFLAADIDWPRPWLQRAINLGLDLQRQAVRFGMIYNGSAHDTSDAAWMLRAQQGFMTFETGEYPRPDVAIFMSWMHYPTHVLPETSTSAMTNLIDAYVAHRACTPAPATK